MSLTKTGMLASLITALIVVSPVSYAIPKAFPLFSPACKEKHIRSAIGDALINMTKLKFDEDLYSYNVTVETSMITYEEMIKKLEKRGCYFE
jgi:hypothetical protein